MGPATRERALEKLAKFTPKIGYPDKWEDYSALEVRPDDLLGNVLRAGAWLTDHELDKIGKPVDRDEWFMTPQTVNAYYHPRLNEIVFPAAILQPPFFDPEADDAANYGGIGAVIGHEIGHGFDDQGSKYDGDGAMTDWWDAADRTEFDRRAQALIDQYSALSPAGLPDHKVNGALTVGENIGDLGGLTIALKAYKIALGDAEAPEIDGAHRLPARLLRLGADLAHHHPRGGGRPQAHDRPPQPARSALQRRRHQPGHVPRGVRRASRRRAVHRARAARADLVSAVTKVAVLGTGIMGAGMARSLARAGLEVVAWNRSPDKAQPLAADGITVVEKAEDAVAGASVVVTMLFDAESVAAVMANALGAMTDGAVWAQTSTVGIDGTAALAELAREHGVGFVDAPVLGTRQPAEEGKLTVLAAGPTALRAAVTPVFDAIGAKTVWVGEEPGAGHRLKLVANAWVLSVVAGTAQSIALAEGLGLEPQVFLDTIAGGAMDAPYVQLKGRAMIADEYPAAFAVDGALKDSGLIA